MTRILLAENVAALVDASLRAQGFSTTVVGDGDETLTLARTDAFDLLVLDLDVPGNDALSVLGELRRTDAHLPVILTGGDSVAHVVAGLEAGADDYLAKPFDLAEFVARIRARARRGHPGAAVLRGGGITLDLRTQRAVVAQRDVELTPRESTLAAELIRHTGRPVSRTQLLWHVWGYQHDPQTNVLGVYVGYLRRKLRPARIVTVRGIGYQLDDDAGAPAPDAR